MQSAPGSVVGEFKLSKALEEPEQHAWWSLAGLCCVRAPINTANGDRHVPLDRQMAARTVLGSAGRSWHALRAGGQPPPLLSCLPQHACF